jgi:hypothetical protein
LGHSLGLVLWSTKSMCSSQLAVSVDFSAKAGLFVPMALSIFRGVDNYLPTHQMQVKFRLGQ